MLPIKLTAEKKRTINIPRGGLHKTYCPKDQPLHRGLSVEIILKSSFLRVCKQEIFQPTEAVVERSKQKKSVEKTFSPTNHPALRAPL